MCLYLSLIALHVSDTLVHHQEQHFGGVYRNWYKPVPINLWIFIQIENNRITEQIWTFQVKSCAAEVLLFIKVIKKQASEHSIFRNGLRACTLFHFLSILHWKDTLNLLFHTFYYRLAKRPISNRFFKVPTLQFTIWSTLGNSKHNVKVRRWLRFSVTNRLEHEEKLTLYKM